MKRPPKLTRKDKIALGKEKKPFKAAKVADGALQAQLAQALEQRRLSDDLADIAKRVEALEAPAVVEQKPQGRPQRDYFGKKETNA